MEGVELELRKFVAPEFVFGVGARRLAGRYAAHLGARKVLVVSDPGVVAAGWTEQVTRSLEEAGLATALFASVTPNPRAEEVMAGAEVYASQGCNAIVAVGGGSPMDCAKGIGIVSRHHRNILEFAGVDRVPSPTPPLVCIPTTSGTSADVSQFAIFSDPAHRVKIAIVSKAVVPDLALIDPETLLTMEPFLTICTGLDALVHAVEAFVSNAHSPLTDVHALEAIRLIPPYLHRVRAEPDNLEVRTKLMLGSLEAGLAFSNASLGGVHAMSHSLGGFLDLPHGQCNALLLSNVVDFNYPAASERYDRLGEAMGIDHRGLTGSARRKAVVDHLRSLAIALGVEPGLGRLGVGRTDVPDLSRNAMRDACIVTNPRRPSQRDIEVIYEEAI